MRPGLRQQAIAGLVVSLVVAATLLGGIFLTLSDSPSQGVAEYPPTATVYRIPTLPLEGSETAPTIVIIPTSTALAPTATRQHATTEPTETCQPPQGWSIYTVRPGETLYRIASRYDLTVGELMQANCLSSTSVSVGTKIYVPPTTPVISPTHRPSSPTPTKPQASPARTPTATITPDPDPPPTGTQTATDGACTNLDSIITLPPVGSILSGKVGFYGTARTPNFDFYKLEIRKEGSSEGFTTFFTGDREVINGLLAEANTVTWTETWGNGLFWIRLVVVNDTGNYPERCSILYTVTN